MSYRLLRITCGVSLLCSSHWLCVAAHAADEDSAKAEADHAVGLMEPIVIAMEEVAVPGPESPSFPTVSEGLYLQGQLAICLVKPKEAVKAYPKAVANRPLYGRIRFASPTANSIDPEEVWAQSESMEYHFMLDACQPPDATTQNGGTRVPGPVILDRLYFDANHDLDLTNDPVRSLVQNPSGPQGSASRRNRRSVFEDVVIHLDAGPDAPKRTVRLAPWTHGRHGVTVGGMISFFPRTAHRGEFELGGRKYVVHLRHQERIYGRFDRPLVFLQVAEVNGNPRKPTAVASGPLGEFRIVGDQVCTVSATPLGDQLTIAPYRGDMGTLKIGDGGRAIDRIGFSGSLVSKTTRISFGPRNAFALRDTRLPLEFSLPVGNYAVDELTVDHGRTRFRCKPRRDRSPGSPTQPLEHRISVRKDVSYVLSFATTPAVVVRRLNPVKEYRRRQTAWIRYQLLDPSNGLVITDLWLSQSGRGDGHSAERDTRGVLDASPALGSTIVIRDSRGNTVVKQATRGNNYQWTIPKDLQLSAARESFSAVVTFDTLDLYGKAEGSCTIVIVDDK